MCTEFINSNEEVELDVMISESIIPSEDADFVCNYFVILNLSVKNILSSDITLFQIPKGLKVNEEVELGVIISKKCKRIKPSEAMDFVAGYCVALELTDNNAVV